MSLRMGVIVNTLLTKLGGDDAVELGHEPGEGTRTAFEMSKQDEALLSQFNDQVDRKLKEKQEQFKLYKTWRDAVRCGKEWRAKNNGGVNPFFIFSNLSALKPNIYAKNPEIEIAPSKQAGDLPNYDALRSMAETCEALLNKEFVESGLKDAMKANVGSALVTGLGWVKVTLQEEFGEDPLIMTRLRDAQDNLASLEALRGDVADDANNDAKRAQLSAQVKSIENTMHGGGEVVIQKGIVIDRIPTEDVLILDPTLVSMSDYKRAKCIAQRVWMTRDDYRRSFGHAVPDGAVSYANREAATGEGYERASDMYKGKDKTQQPDALVQVWELWDGDSQTVYTFAKGAKSYAREPYCPEWTGERWYPFFALWFNDVDGSLDPVSDVETQIDLQAEYAHLRSKIKDTRDKQKTTMVGRKAGDMQATDFERINASEGIDIVFIGGNPEIPISQDLQQAPSPQLNLQLFDPAMIMRDSEMALRSGDAARGYINKAKTATEAEIMNMGLQSFTAERQDTVEDMLTDMAKYALEILLLSYSDSDVKQVVGASAFWQQMPIDAVFKYLSLNIRAGSMSKPNKFKDREQWMQLLPVLQQGVQQIAQFVAQGQQGMADAAKHLLEETLTRFDERIDLNQFIPQIDVQTQQMQQMQQMQAKAQAGQGGQQQPAAQPQTM